MFLKTLTLVFAFFVFVSGPTYGQENSVAPVLPTTTPEPNGPESVSEVNSETSIPAASSPATDQTNSEGELIGNIKMANPDNLLDPQNPTEESFKDQLEFLRPQINVNDMKSLTFTKWEHDLIVDARRGLNAGLSTTEIMNTGPAITDISLGGILYMGAKDWTIWLNNTRVTPDAIPSEVLDLKVYKDYIEIEWFDSSKNLIYPIRLRTQQRFNLETRMFLPG